MLSIQVSRGSLGRPAWGQKKEGSAGVDLHGGRGEGSLLYMYNRPKIYVRLDD